MKPVKQKISDKNIGDCFRACMASLLELPNDERLPHIDKQNWHSDWRKLLNKFGMILYSDNKKIWFDGYWIASVPSKNYENTTHAIIMNFNKVAFDPSTKKRYRKGIILHSDIVSFGEALIVSDVSKLKELEKFRSNLLSTTNKEEA